MPNLARQGYQVYFPRVVQPVRTREGWRERIAPLFPRYLFVRLNVGRQAFAPLRSTLGVSGVVRFGSEYARVPDPVITGLRSREDATTGLHHLGRPAPLTLGAPVRIVDGVFDGLEGIFVRASGDERVFVLLELLGAPTQVQVPAICVEARGARREALAC